ncbi:UNVERIFIED_CONTAM: Bidirectional sugar transporter SWEET16 [Sesamum latifolium]|uniref:Bidirectional sugar transporter SWEET16 n=1 Tax=Sesamum latifolium TaxID=2727402 RepID=A0AAW2XLS7_9LAMI
MNFRGTFREIVKKKSSENYKGVPYVTTLLSTSLWTFYGALDPDDGVLIVTVNAVGVVSQAAYLVLFLFYASKERKVKYLGLVLLDLLFLGVVIATTLAAFHGNARRTFIGVLCATFTIAMYAAPLSATVPNAVGIVLGSLQLIVYVVYKNKSSSSELIDRMADGEKLANKAKSATETQDVEQGINDISWRNGKGLEG